MQRDADKHQKLAVHVETENSLVLGKVGHSLYLLVPHICLSILKLVHVFHVSFIFFEAESVLCGVICLEGARQMDRGGFEVVVCEVP